ncbi:DUF1836 domain-containing protein [Lacticaseibacillus zhaodongensis]|uniref:DUF1836 domain-containing protein n=1 Tax=Lacticaseibacillus zhaodongensis TaxID=2668065 RepID=UPI0012D36665|nr:DUF1836 domain-containing protein [Lacticaseibacillus zhaodongensis]
MSDNQEFNEYLQQLSAISWPRWTDLPQFDLYMDQVVQFVNDLVRPAGMGELTPTMVNNYVKKGIITAPKKKKYTRGQLANIIVIAILKPVFSLDTIAGGIRYQLKNREAQQAFDAFILQFASAVHSIAANFGGELVINSLSEADTTVIQDAMGQLAIKAVVQKLLVEMMVKMVTPEPEGKHKE